MAHATEQLVCVADFEKKARQLIPKMALDYYCGGADDEQTLRDNMEAFKRFVTVLFEFKVALQKSLYLHLYR